MVGGEVEPLKLIALNANGTTSDVTTDTAITWKSSNPKVATVSGGSVTPVGAGNTIITAIYGGKTTTISVTVREATK